MQDQFDSFLADLMTCQKPGREAMDSLGVKFRGGRCDCEHKEAIIERALG